MNRYAVIVVFIASVVCPASAETVYGTQINYDEFSAARYYKSTILPPRKYRHRPNYDATINRLSALELKYHCRNEEVNGCLETHTEFENGHKVRSWYVINIPAHGERIRGHIVSDKEINAILQHEIAHMNGWRADHPRY